MNVKQKIIQLEKRYEEMVPIYEQSLKSRKQFFRNLEIAYGQISNQMSTNNK